MDKTTAIATFGQFPLSAEIRKYSKYEVIDGTFSDGTFLNRYIVPEKGAKLEAPFDIFEKYEVFVKDLFSIIDITNGNDYINILADDNMNQQQIDSNLESSILRFVSKYGLLGFIKNAIMPLTDILKRTPTVKDITILPFYENSYYPRKFTTEKNSFIRQDTTEEEEYGESVTEIFGFIKEMYRFLNNWSENRNKLKMQFKSQHGELPLLFGDTWLDYFRKFKAKNINIGFDYEDFVLKLKLEDMELFEIIKLIVVLDCTPKGHKFSICKYCKNPYFVLSRNAVYCDDYDATLTAEDNPDSCFNKAKRESKRIRDRLNKGESKDLILDVFQKEGSPFVTMELINEIEHKKLGKRSDD